jgi:hypothetical protein
MLLVTSRMTRKKSRLGGSTIMRWGSWRSCSMVGVKYGRASAWIVLLVRSSARGKLLVMKVMVDDFGMLSWKVLVFEDVVAGSD